MTGKKGFHTSGPILSLTARQTYTNICSVKGLTSRQAEILRFVRDQSKASGFPPSVREIGERFGLYPATVHDHIKALERKGYLYRQPNRSRALVVVEPDTTADNRHMTPTEIPVVGRVAAGAPILAEENVEDVVRFPSGWAPDDAFLLRVEGDSMQEAHILDGDYVLVHPQKSASNGEIIVALIEDEATVKRFYRSKGVVELRPENPAFEPIKISGSDGTQFGIVGKVIGVLRL